MHRWLALFYLSRLDNQGLTERPVKWKGSHEILSWCYYIWKVASWANLATIKCWGPGTCLSQCFISCLKTHKLYAPSCLKPHKPYASSRILSHVESTRTQSLLNHYNASSMLNIHINIIYLIFIQHCSEAIWKPTAERQHNWIEQHVFVNISLLTKHFISTLKGHMW